MICGECRKKHGMDPIVPHPDGRVEFLRCDICNGAFFQSFPNKDRRVMAADYRDDWIDVNEVDESDLKFD